jgi:hypothetical protein
MNPNHHSRPGSALARKAAWLAFSLITAASQPAPASPAVALWDTSAPLPDNFSLEDRAAWKTVPGELLHLETDPPTALSDPGYYGREYAFQGDAIVETRQLAAVFCSAKGRVAIYAKEDAGARKLLEIAPLEARAHPASITRVTIRSRSGDELALEAAFSSAGAPEATEVFAFARNGVIEIKPGPHQSGITLSGPIAYGIVPGFIGDDLVYKAADYPAATALSLPAENIFLGLLEGERQEFVLTWPRGQQQITLQLGRDPSGGRLIDSVDFAHDGQSLFLALLDAPGLWHRQALLPSGLEKDLAIPWKKPFPARWKTQLNEGGVKTTFTFRDDKQDIWRGVSGSYTYPVWFTGDTANYHLSKKVPPEGESLIYCLEPQDTPPSINTPADILQATLGRSLSDAILDREGRQLSTHHRRGGDGVRRACTCGCTEAIQAVFAAQQETAKKDYIAGAVDDMIYFVHRHVERIDHYQAFAAQIIQYLTNSAALRPDLRPCLDSLAEIARQIPGEYDVQKENMKSFAYADDLARQTLALAGKTDPNNLKAYGQLLEAWRAMGGSQDYVLAQCHVLTRKLCQQAGYACADQPGAAALAEEIRSRCRQCLRNPDGYEIWADY